VPDVSQVVSLVVAGVLGGIGLWWSRRGLRKAGVGAVSRQTIENLRDLADSWEAKFDVKVTELAAERLAHAATTALLADEKAESDRCARQLSSAYAELNAIGHRRQPRPPRART
jgi:hypothetical protein